MNPQLLPATARDDIPALGAGGGSPARQDSRRGTQELGPRGPARWPPRMRLSSAAAERRHLRGRPPPQAPRLALRGLEPEGSPGRRNVGRTGTGPGRRYRRGRRHHRVGRRGPRVEPPARSIDRARIDRQIRELALEHAAGGLGDDTYLTRLKALREQRDAIVERTAPGLPGHRAVEWLRALSESVQLADVPKEKADLMHAIYERITVAGPEIVGVRLTAAAYAHGLALALPEKVEMARPTGVGRAITTYSMPIEGRDEWLAAARRPA
jgi:hypothetical protein